MKIFIVANIDFNISNFRKELVLDLVANHDVSVIAEPTEYCDDLLSLGCSFIPMSIERRGTNPLSDFSLLLKYIKLFSKHKPDIILTYTIKPNIYANLAASLNHIPVISTITGIGDAFNGSFILKKIVVFLYKISSSNRKCIFFQNQDNLNTFKKLGIVSEFTNTKLVNGSGVNLSEFSFSPIDFSNNKINFLFIGRIYREKGIDELLDVAKLLNQKYDNICINLVGFIDDDRYKSLVTVAEGLGHIKYHGFKQDVRPYIKDSHCVVLPSYGEGMANVLLEAAAMGRPLIATNINGCKEIIDDGINGFLCERKNSESLYSSMEKFILIDNETKASMGLKSREKVEREFDRDLIVQSYVEEINKIY